MDNFTKVEIYKQGMMLRNLWILKLSEDSENSSKVLMAIEILEKECEELCSKIEALESQEGKA